MSPNVLLKENQHPDWQQSCHSNQLQREWQSQAVNESAPKKQVNKNMPMTTMQQTTLTVVM